MKPINLGREEAINLVDNILSRGFHFDGEGIHFTSGKHYLEGKKSGDFLVTYCGITFNLK